MASRRFKKSRNPRRVLRPFFLILLLVLGGGAFFLFFEGDAPQVNISQLPEYLGKTDSLDIEVTDRGSGLRHVQVSVSQNGSVKQLYTITHPRLTYTGQVGPLSDRQTLAFDAEKLGFKDGPVEISVTARDFSLRGMLAGNSAEATTSATLDTKPPRIRILHSEKYISPGGAGIAIYQVSDATDHHGVILNGMFNKGYPVNDNRKDTYIAYFALPYDAESIDDSKLIARDVAGNNATAPFSTILKKARQKQDKINVSDGFLSTKIPEFEQYYPNLSGSLLEKYLETNQTIRRENNQRISDLCKNPVDEMLWEGRFLRMAGSSRAGFADHRTYFYAGKPIDKQVHLGMDIASTKRAAVKAANTGKVVFADYLGIYGNMVLIDHGQGVFSLYSHLSQITVATEDMVAGGDTIGHTGTSGMAGGDHLHFSMLINGVFATPIEWWDPHWISVTIEEPLVDSKF